MLRIWKHSHARNTTSPEHIHLNATSFSTFELRFPSGGYPSAPTGETGGSGSSKYRLFVFVKYGEEFIHHANVSIGNMTWSLTDVFGRALFRLPYGTYEVKAEKEGLGYPQKVTLLIPFRPLSSKATMRAFTVSSDPATQPLGPKPRVSLRIERS